jgi:hypothetical protein
VPLLGRLGSEDVRRGPFMVGLFEVAAGGGGTRSTAGAGHWSEESLQPTPRDGIRARMTDDLRLAHSRYPNSPDWGLPSDTHR